MKLWTTRILAALLTFTLGAGAVALLRYRPAPKARAVSDTDGAKVVFPEFTPARERAIEPPTPTVAISPYEIKRLVDEDGRADLQGQPYVLDLNPIWKLLNIAPDDFINLCKGCYRADIFRLELDGKPGDEALLSLYASGNQPALYLIFKQVSPRHGSGPEWKLLGYIHQFLWYDEPSFKVITIGPRRLLAIRNVTGHGPGFGSDDEVWYEVGASGVREFFRYPIGLYQATIAADYAGAYRADTKLLSTAFKDGTMIVSLQFSNSYECYPDLEGQIRFTLWTAKRRLTFVKSVDSEHFRLDPLNSEMSEKELADLSGEGFWSEVLRYNYAEVARVAASKDSSRRAWLDGFLAYCEDSPQKESLQRILDSK